MLPHIDVEALLERGEQASFVLAHPMFEGAMNDLANYHTVAMIEAPEGPVGADARNTTTACSWPAGRSWTNCGATRPPLMKRRPP